MCFLKHLTRELLGPFKFADVVRGSKTAKKLNTCLATSQPQLLKVANNWGLFLLRGKQLSIRLMSKKSHQQNVFFKKHSKNLLFAGKYLYYFWVKQTTAPFQSL